MLTAVVMTLDMDTLEERTAQSARHADVIEWRLDALEQLDIERLAALRKTAPSPLIFTLRPPSQGGQFSGTEQERQAILIELAGLAPDYMDVEHDVPESVLERIRAASGSSGMQIIRSFHDFEGTPRDLDLQLAAMHSPLADHYKFITTANDVSDALRVLELVRRKTRNMSLTAHAMGPFGEFTRVLGAAFGNSFTYASAPGQNASPAPGSISLMQMKYLYNINGLNQNTGIFALLGDPVDRSAGHIYHNRCFHAAGRNAVYVRIAIREYELGNFFEASRDWPMRGFSITMPLKETILRQADALGDGVQWIDAANTLTLSDGRWQADNCDGRGALDALENKAGALQGKSVLVVGAGGTARAIAFEATRRGGHVTIINRTAIKARMAAGRIGCRSRGLDRENWVEPYDAIINTLPHTATNAIDWADKLPKLERKTTVVMDVVYKPRLSPLLKLAQARGLPIVLGRTMFRNQAAIQQAFWRT